MSAIRRLRKVEVVFRDRWIDLWENGKFVGSQPKPEGLYEDVFLDSFAERVNAVKVERKVVITLMFTCWRDG